MSESSGFRTLERNAREMILESLDVPSPAMIRAEKEEIKRQEEEAYYREMEALDREIDAREMERMADYYRLSEREALEDAAGIRAYLAEASGDYSLAYDLFSAIFGHACGWNYEISVALEQPEAINICHLIDRLFGPEYWSRDISFTVVMAAVKVWADENDAILYEEGREYFSTFDAYALALRHGKRRVILHDLS